MGGKGSGPAAGQGGGKRAGSGRKKKSPARQKAEGNVGHRPDHNVIPFDVVKKPPEPPAWLNEYAREFWREHAPQLVLMKILTTVSLPDFAILADQWGQFREADAELVSLTVESRGAETVAPLLRIKNDAAKLYHSMAASWQVLPSAATIAVPTGGTRAGDFSRAK